MTSESTLDWINEHYGVVTEERGALHLTLVLDPDRDEFPKLEFVTPPGLDGYSLRLVRTFRDTIEFTRTTPTGERSTRTLIPTGAESIAVRMHWSAGAILLEVRTAEGYPGQDLTGVDESSGVA